MAKPMMLDEKSFDETILKSKLPVLVDFWAPLCPPCRAIAPIVEELAQEYSSRLTFAKLNVDEAPTIPSRYGIHSIPTLIIFKDGKPQLQVIGLKPKKELKELLEKALA